MDRDARWQVPSPTCKVGSPSRPGGKAVPRRFSRDAARASRAARLGLQLLGAGAERLSGLAARLCAAARLGGVQSARLPGADRASRRLVSRQGQIHHARPAALASPRLQPCRREPVQPAPRWRLPSSVLQPPERLPLGARSGHPDGRVGDRPAPDRGAARPHQAADSHAADPVPHAALSIWYEALRGRSGGGRCRAQARVRLRSARAAAPLRAVLGAPLRRVDRAVHAARRRAPVGGCANARGHLHDGGA
mmetsp:Transcript_33795/g.79523  ORF Transcript_33795/g.79523 Transcript_33795/m.79523 type:complete len:250 (-) Transcript_33795:192-941(-)